MDPQLYFTQLLMNLPSWPANGLDAWLPDRWNESRKRPCSAEKQFHCDAKVLRPSHDHLSQDAVQAALTKIPLEIVMRTGQKFVAVVATARFE
jgi:hypothetical protein